MQGEIKMRFFDYSVTLKKDGSIVLDDIDANTLGIGPGDGFMAFVDPVTREVTLQKVDLTKVEHVTATPVLERV